MGVVARHPTLVHHTARARSREGFLNVDEEQDGSNETGRPLRGENDGVGVGAVDDSSLSEALQNFETPLETPSEDVDVDADGDADDDDDDDEVSPKDMDHAPNMDMTTETGTMMRTEDVDLGTPQRFRRISAGSARLLEIGPRGSVSGSAGNRLSMASTVSHSTTT